MTDAGQRPDLDDQLAELAVATDLRHDVFRAVVLLGELRVMTRWELDVLREQLGCNPERWLQMGGAPERKPADMARDSVEFLVLVRDMAQVVDRYDDCRQVLVGICDLSASTDGDLAARTSEIREAFNTKLDRYTAKDYLLLGEIGTAMRVAALSIGHGDAHRRAANATSWLAPAAALITHISPDRLVLLDAPDASEQLGSKVRQQMLVHLAQCSVCGTAHDSLGLPARSRRASGTTAQRAA